MADEPELTVRERLEAIRDRLTGELDHAEGSQLAAVAKQLVDVIAKIDALPAKKASAVDDLAAKRARRRGTAAPDKAGVDKQRGSGSGRARGKRGAAAGPVAGT